MKYDMHMHSSISLDSEESLFTMVAAAREQDLDGICFTQHLDPYFPDDFQPFPIDWEKYNKEIRTVRMALPQMEILMGLEAGMNEHSWDELSRQIQENDLDFVLGSLHCTDEMTIGEYDYYTRHERVKTQTDYLECLLKNVQHFDDFDCVAHIGFLAKFAPGEEWAIHYGDFTDLIDELLKTVIQKGKGIELNTSSLKRSAYTMPAEDILRRYRELGGEILTLGSDAHAKEWIAYEFDFAGVLAAKCGFTQLTKYVKRKPVYYDF